MADYLEFMRERLGKNWVLVHARRKKPRYDHRGFLQTQVNHRQYDEMQRAWRLEHGREYDPPRAAMYMALVDCEKAIGKLERNGDLVFCERLLGAVRQALEAERATF